MATLTVTLPLSDEDKQVLHTLLGTDQAVPAAPAPAPAAPKKAQSAKVAEKITTANAEAAKAKEEPTPEPAPEPEPAAAEEPADEDLIGGEEFTLKGAMEEAAALVAKGKMPDVKKALDAIGVARVSKIPADKVEEFVLAIRGL